MIEYMDSALAGATFTEAGLGSSGGWDVRRQLETVPGQHNQPQGNELARDEDAERISS